MNCSTTNESSTLKKSLSTLLAFTMLALLSACAGAPTRENLDMQISSTADVNPDMQGRPSPLSCIYWNSVRLNNLMLWIT